MSFRTLYIEPVPKDIDDRAWKIDARYQAGKTITAEQTDFVMYHMSLCRQVGGKREGIKQEGWKEFHDEALADDVRAHGIEKVIFSHWMRACVDIFATAGTTDRETYAAHWLEANGEGLVTDPKILAILRKRYPLKGALQIRHGYTSWNELPKTKTPKRRRRA